MSKKEKIERKIQREINSYNQPHERVIHLLAKKLRKRNYAKIFRNLDYSNKQDNEAGELDILALKGFYNGEKRRARIFEVKSSSREECTKKAISQLEKSVKEIKAFYGEEVRCFKFYVYSSNNLVYPHHRGKRKKHYLINWVRN